MINHIVYDPWDEMTYVICDSCGEKESCADNPEYAKELLLGNGWVFGDKDLCGLCGNGGLRYEESDGEVIR